MVRKTRAAVALLAAALAFGTAADAEWRELPSGWAEIQTSGSGGITNSAGANVVGKSDGTNIVASTITDNGTLVTINTRTKARATVLTDGTGPALGVTATLPASPSAAVSGVSVNVTSAGSAAQTQRAATFTLAAGYTGTTEHAAVSSSVATAGGNNDTGSMQIGLDGSASPTSGAGWAAGVRGKSSGSTSAAHMGVVGASDSTTYSIGSYGSATAGASTRVGGWFDLAGNPGNWPGAAALLADNGSVAAPIFLARDNGTTKVSIEDGGALCGNSSKTLTESSATGFLEIAVASGAVASAEIDYEVEATDTTDHQVLSGTLRVNGVNKAGTVTANIAEVGSQLSTLSTGTLTVTNTVTAGTGKFTVNANAVSSLTQTTLRIKYLVRSAKPITVTSL